LFGDRSGDTKAQSPVPAGSGGINTAIPGSATNIGGVPSTAAGHVKRTPGGDHRVNSPRKSFDRNILAKFEYIPVHVVQSERIRLLSRDLMGVPLPFGAAVANDCTPPRIVAQFARVIPKAERRRRSGTAGIFPFCFRRKSKFGFFRFAQLFAECLSILP